MALRNLPQLIWLRTPQRPQVPASHPHGSQFFLCPFGMTHSLNLSRNFYPGPLALLRSISATGAPFDSLDRSPAPKCHPGTRSDLLDKIYTWVDSPYGEKLCWVHGPAGAGKSAIAQTVAERCAERGQLAASFFFSRSAPPRDASRRFFTTLAWQLASSMPDKKDAIYKAVGGGRVLDQKHEIQMLQLIVRPLLTSIDPGVAARPFVIIVDGLDECKSDNDQTQLLNHIYDLVETHRVPLRFLIVSRPEPHIRHFFTTTSRNKDISREISLHGDHQAHKDIGLFLRSRFDEMAVSERHTYSLNHLPRPWPPDEVVSLLQRRSEGYFIYASTVLKYIDDEHSSCVARLEDVLGASNSSSSIFAELDKLYKQILSKYPDTHKMVRILGGLLVESIPFQQVEVECLALLYDLRPGEIMQMLRSLQSVLKIEEEDGILSTFMTVRSHHASFLDFLFDRDRSGIYHINELQVCRDVYEGMVSFVSDYESRRPSIEYWCYSRS
jgi:hypothetical protein